MSSIGECVTWPATFICDLSSESAEITGVALAAATELLDSLTGHQFGQCQLTIRPCRRTCSDTNWPFIIDKWWEFGVWPRPLFYNGVWYNLTCSSCVGGCACTALSEVMLPDNVTSIDEVKVDGVVLDSSAYRVDNFRILVRIDGEEWPICNELNEDDTETGTWSVKATYGQAIPVLGQLAVGELTCEIVNLLTGNSECKLPVPTQSVVRQGVAMNFIDPTTILGQGRVGLYLSDMFITSVNPQKITSRAQVFDIDNPQSYRITGTA